jgi:hypothetical protein
MTKWLHTRFADGAALKHEYFPSQELAAQALQTTLDAYTARGHTVTEKSAGPDCRYDIHDAEGFLASHWLSDDYAA